jgi:hypothetical protein
MNVYMTWHTTNGLLAIRAASVAFVERNLTLSFTVVVNQQAFNPQQLNEQ